MVRTWLFGEAEYESTETMEQNFKRLWDCGEACGYMVSTKKYENGTTAIILNGADLECVQIHYKDDKMVGITKQQWTDRKGEMELLESGAVAVYS